MAPPVILSMQFYDTVGEPDKARRALMKMPYVNAVTVKVHMGMILVEGPTNAIVAEMIRYRLQEKMGRVVNIVSDVGPEPECSGSSPGPPPPARPSGYPPPPPMVQYFPPPPPAAPYGYHPPAPPQYAPPPPPPPPPPVQEPDEYQWAPYNREHIYTPSYFSDENPNSCSVQ